jgi:hypothetical protein
MTYSPHELTTMFLALNAFESLITLIALYGKQFPQLIIIK